MPLTPSLRYCSNKYKLAREGEKDKEKDEDIEKGNNIFFFFMKSSSVERDEFSVVAFRMGVGRSFHRNSGTRMFWRVILSLSVMVPRGVAH